MTGEPGSGHQRSSAAELPPASYGVKFTSLICPSCGRVVPVETGDITGYSWLGLLDEVNLKAAQSCPRWNGEHETVRIGAFPAGPAEVPERARPALTDDDHAALSLCKDLANAMNRVMGGGSEIRADWGEFTAHLHAIQHVIMAQAAARAYPDRYRLLGAGWADVAAGADDDALTDVPWLADCQFEIDGHEVRATHRPTGAGGCGLTRAAAINSLTADLLARGKISINDARAVHRLPPFRGAAFEEMRPAAPARTATFAGVLSSGDYSVAGGLVAINCKAGAEARRRRFDEFAAAIHAPNMPGVRALHAGGPVGDAVRSPRPFARARTFGSAVEAGLSLDEACHLFATVRAPGIAADAGLPGESLEVWSLPLVSFTLEFLITPAGEWPQPEPGK